MRRRGDGWGKGRGCYILVMRGVAGVCLASERKLMNSMTAYKEGYSLDLRHISSLMRRWNEIF